MKQFFNDKTCAPISRRDPGYAYARALEVHERIEAELARAQNRWQKSRARLKRLGKRLDRVEQAALLNQQLDTFNDEIPI